MTQKRNVKLNAQLTVRTIHTMSVKIYTQHAAVLHLHTNKHITAAMQSTADITWASEQQQQQQQSQQPVPLSVS